MTTIRSIPVLVWRMLRLETTLLLILHSLTVYSLAILDTGLHFSVAVSYHLIELTLAAMVIASWYVNATTINDLADFEIDKVNLSGDKQRPLVTGEGSRQDLRNIWLFSALVMIICSLVFPLLISFVVVLMILLNWAYSMRPIQLSHRGIVAPLMLPVGYVLLPAALGVAASESDLNARSILLICGLYLVFVARVMLKDFRDVEGDRMHGKLTFLLRHDSKFVTYSSMSTFVLGMVLLLFVVGFNITLLVLLLITSIVLELDRGLSRVNRWESQKEYIPYIGRMKTLVLMLLLVRFIFESDEIVYFQYFALTIIFAAISIYNANQLSAFNQNSNGSRRKQ